MIAVLDQCVTSELINWEMHLIYTFKFSCHVHFTLFIFDRAYGSGKEDAPMCDVPDFENARMKLLRHVSFVDCPVSISSETLLN